ncbi:MAG: hypothetical protein HY901_12025 [Deltaproteobacteria bacterium]|nr:hypothetical protein [Deltaproteobacteria bacterium]
MATKSKTRAVTKVTARAVLRKSEYGFDQPTLVVTARLSGASTAARENHAFAFRAAAEIELALADANDMGWMVNAPHWGDEQRLPEGWQSTWGINLEAGDGAQTEIAMKALDEVATKLSKPTRR